LRVLRVLREEKVSSIKVSIIVCTYSIEFLSDTFECISSLTSQNYADKEILLVMDENYELYRLLIDSLPESVNIIINKHPGLSEARNLGIKNATGDIIVFIDDDAVADNNYISNMIKNYEDKNIVGVVGKILPKEKPNYPEELYWIGGFTYKGFPDKRCEVRNVLGCNMSFRKEIFDKVGFFDINLGRVGKNLVTAEETEFCIRVLNSLPGSKIIYDPSVIVYHKVHGYRQTFRYMMRRGYHEGVSKAHIGKLYYNKDGGSKALSTEQTYLRYLLAKAIPARIGNMLVGRDVVYNTKETIALLMVTVSVGFGYIIGRIE